MAVLDAVDAFIGADGQNLTVRDWAKQAGGGDVILSTGLSGPNRRARANTNSACRYLKAEVPSQAEHTVGSQWLKRSGHGQGGIMVRGAAGADTAYVFEHVHSSGLLRLLRVVNGSATVLASAAHAWPADTPRQLWLLARTRDGGATVRVTGRVRANGGEPQVLTVDDTAATRILAEGQAGIRLAPGIGTLLEQRSYQCERWWLASVDPDARPRADRPASGPLAQRIRAKAPEERAAERAAVLHEASAPPGWQVTRGGTVYSLSLPQGLSRSGGALIVPEVACSPAPLVPLDPGGYRFVNPPILVPDGTVHEETDARGEPVLVANFVEDPREALRQIVADTVLRGLPE